MHTRLVGRLVGNKVVNNTALGNMVMLCATTEPRGNHHHDMHAMEVCANSQAPTIPMHVRWGGGRVHLHGLPSKLGRRVAQRLALRVDGARAHKCVALRACACSMVVAGGTTGKERKRCCEWWWRPQQCTWRSTSARATMLRQHQAHQGHTPHTHTRHLPVSRPRPPTVQRPTTSSASMVTSTSLQYTSQCEAAS